MTYFDIDNYSPNKAIMPTAIYLNRNYVPIIGTKAIEQYINDNTGRIIHLEKEELGEIYLTYGETSTFKGRDNDAGDTTFAVKVHAMVEQDMPGHLFRSLKRWLGSKSIDKVRVFDKHYRIVALITTILIHIKKTTEMCLGHSIESLHIGKPVQFEGTTVETNALAIKRIYEACDYAGLKGVSFYPEPIGAALSYLHNQESLIGKTVLVFDFGGGTLDLCLVKKDKNNFEILATHGVPIGGNLIDQKIFESKLFNELGQGCLIPDIDSDSPRLRQFPFEKFAKGILNWHQTYTLNTPDFLRYIHTGIKYNNDVVSEKLMRLHDLIRFNYSYFVFRAIEQAKFDLSFEDTALIEISELNLSVQITRSEFESIISSILLEIRACIDTTLDMGGVKENDAVIVVRTGGSSQIPIIKNLLEENFLTESLNMTF
ncbi:heat shock protein, Hsp70 family protein [Beggiatoa sp. PS]|nr:heat shock protein, Hsp70 family protein [Beggiatoa sp. PS]